MAQLMNTDPRRVAELFARAVEDGEPATRVFLLFEAQARMIAALPQGEQEAALRRLRQEVEEGALDEGLMPSSVRTLVESAERWVRAFMGQTPPLC